MRQTKLTNSLQLSATTESLPSNWRQSDRTSHRYRKSRRISSDLVWASSVLVEKSPGSASEQTDEDIYREKVLESYGYKFMRINRFNVGEDPIQTLDKRIASLVNPRKDNHEIVHNIHETIDGLLDGEMKECPKCKQIKKLEDFKDGSLISGIGRICKACKGMNNSKNTKRQVAESTSSILCPRCRSAMVPRTGRRGKFFGCSRFPYCRGTRPRS